MSKFYVYMAFWCRVNSSHWTDKRTGCNASWYNCSNTSSILRPKSVRVSRTLAYREPSITYQNSVFICSDINDRNTTLYFMKLCGYTVVERLSKNGFDERTIGHVVAVASSNFWIHSDESHVRFYAAQKRSRCARGVGHLKVHVVSLQKQLARESNYSRIILRAISTHSNCPHRTH